VSLFCKRDLSCESQKRPKLLNNVCRSFLTYFSSLRARLAVHLVCSVPVCSGARNIVLFCRSLLDSNMSLLTYVSFLRARLAVHFVCGVPVSSGSWNCVDTGEEYYADHVGTLFSADGLSVY